MEELQAEQHVAPPQEEAGPGRMLAAAREARGVTVDDVAMRLKFAPRQIEALEADQYDQLPGIAIVRGMVRNYARLLEIDAAPLVAELEQRLGTGPASVRPTDMHVPIKEGRKESRMFLVLSLIVLIAVGAFALDWYVRGQRMNASATLQPSAADERVQPLDTEVQPLPASEAAVTATKVSTATVTPAPPVVEPAPSQPIAPAEADAPAVEETVSNPPAHETPATTSVSAAAEKALHMRFNEEVWVEVKDANDRLLVARLAPAGSQIALDGVAPLSLVLGNADAVEVVYQGEPVEIRAGRSGVARLTLE